MTGQRWASLGIVAAAAAIFSWLGGEVSQAKPLGGLDFRALYEGAAVLIHHQDPFNPAEVRAYYVATGDAKLYPEWALYTLALLDYPPTLYLFVAPFAALSWHAAQLLWTSMTALCFVGAAFVMWRHAEKSGTLMAGCLIGLILANSEILLAGGNAAGIASGLSVLGAWFVIEERWPLAAVLCFAASLAMKPHDGGFIWLYFLLVGGRRRTRAAQALGVDLMLGLASLIWISQVAPHWFPEMRQTMEIYSAHGGANDPGVIGGATSHFRSSAHAVYPGMVCDLQSLVAPFRDDPEFYNPVTYAVCAPLLAIWVVVTLRSQFTKERAYLALAAIVPLTLLVTYHRTTDAKLLLLTVPACVALWRRGGIRGKLALALTSMTILGAGDISLIVIGMITGSPDWMHAGWLKTIAYVFVYRPVPILLLATCLFYLWVYVESAHKSGGDAALLVPANAER